MKISKVLARVAAALALGTGCASAQETASTALRDVQRIGLQVQSAQARLEHGDVTDAERFASVVIRDAADWRARLRQHRAGSRDAETARKAFQVGALLDRVQARAAALPLAAIEPAPGPATDLYGLESERSVGASCAAPIAIEAGRAVEVMLARAGRPRSELWLRIPLDKAPRKVSTEGSGVDPVIERYGDCDGSPSMRIDDTDGLQASMTIEPATGSQWALLRIANLGDTGILRVSTHEATAATTINGRVTDATTGTGLAGTFIVLYDAATQSWVGSAQTDANGYYAAQAFEGTSAVFVRTSDRSIPARARDEAFSQVPCVAHGFELAECPGSLTAVTLPATSVNFVLPKGIVVSGRMTDVGTGAPIVSGAVELYRSNGAQIAAASTDAQGRFRITGLAPGTVYVVAKDTAHMTQRYAGCDCDDPFVCDPLSGDAIELRDGEATVLDFAMTPSSVINLSVLVDGAPTFTNGTARLRRPDGTLLRTQQVSAGVPRVGPVSPGSYVLELEGDGTYPQLTGGIDCVPTCLAVVASATPVVVTLGAPAPTASFDLALRPRLRGRVAEVGTGVGIGTASVVISSATGGYYDFADIAADGTYVIDRIPEDDYYVHVHSRRHIDQAWPNVPCEATQPILNCSGYSALRFDYANRDRTIDFDLQRRASLTGHLRTFVGPPVEFYYTGVVQLLAGGANQEVIGPSLALAVDGTYELSDIPPGTFIAGASALRYWAQLHPGRDCAYSAAYGFFPGCPFAQATPITFTEGELRSGVDFALKAKGGRLVRVIEATSGAPIPGVAIDVWSANQNLFNTWFTNADGWVDVTTEEYPNYPTTPYYLSTGNISGYVDEVYDNRSCAIGSAYAGTCALTGGTTIALPEIDSGKAPIVIALEGDALFSGSFE